MAAIRVCTIWLLSSLCALSAFLGACTAQCIPSEPHVDCNFYEQSSPSWGALSSKQSAERLTAAWKDSVAQTAAYPAGRFEGQGLVVTATKLDLVNLPVLLETLQAQGANIPVEIWYSGEIDAALMGSLFSAYTKLTVKNLVNYASPDDLHSSDMGSGDRVFQAKPIAILNSAFEDVLFLDADNIPLSNPATLFSTSEYKSTGALFWPDFWQTASANPIWDILGLSAGGWEQESGQMVINKRCSWAALNLAVFLAKDPAFQQMVNGDKEAFRLAFLATRTSFHMVETPVATAGMKLEGGQFCGHTMVQHDTQGEPLFLHHNSIKHGASIVWDVMKAVPAGKSFMVVPLPPATINDEPVSCLDLTGDDVIATPAPFASFAKTFARSQASTSHELKAVAKNEFVAILQQTTRKLLQGNGSFTVPADGATCPAGANYCYSSGGTILTCCLSTCSGVYANADPVTGDARQFCSLPGGGVDNPGTPVASTPSPSAQAAGVPPGPDGQCGQINYRQPCYPSGAASPSICCRDSGFQCANTNGPSPLVPFCQPIPST